MDTDVKIINRRKDFDLHAGLDLPIRVRKHKHNDCYLFIAPEKASFFTTNDMGNRLMDMFIDGKTIQNVIDVLKSDGHSMDIIVKELHSLLVKIEKKGFYESSPIKEIIIKEPSLHLDLTMRCNLSCVHCLRDAGTGDRSELATDEWLDIIDKFTSLYKTRVCLSGGEAMLHPGFFKIVSRAKEKGLHVTVFTNGTLIKSQAIADKVAKYADKVQVSVDGTCDKVNDSIRGKGSFEKVIRAVQYLKNTSITLDVAISVMPQNVADLNENIEKLDKLLGPRVNLRISPSIKEGRATGDHVFTSKKVGQLEIQKLSNNVYKKKLKFSRTHEKNIKLNSCGYGETVVVSSVGDIYPCNFYEPRVRYGNVREEGLFAIIKKMNKEREAVSVESIKECKACDFKFFCYGGCRLNNLYRNNDLFKPACGKTFKNTLLEQIVEKEEQPDPLDRWLEESNNPNGQRGLQL
jgi:radical SAM protein with 4Fe4S-binding SPASM domain